MTTQVLLVTGSRACADTPAAEAWARGVLSTEIHALPRGSVVAHGGALGPDTWADDIAELLGIERWEYRLDGKAYVNGVAVDEWTACRREDFPPRAWPLHRNAQMVGLVSCRGTRSVTAVALRAGWAKTNGTGHTIDLCRNAGIPTTVHVAPADAAPGRTR